MSKIKKFLIGNPLSSEEEQHQRLTKRIALPVFASDAISSTAYATDEILVVTLIGAGAGAAAAGAGAVSALGGGVVAQPCRIIKDMVRVESVAAEISRCVMVISILVDD